MRIDMDDGSDIAVDMAPLIDCVFLLLIFFLVSSTIKKPELEIPVNLPEAAISAGQNADPAPTIVTIDRSGQFYMNGLPIGQSELHRRLKEFSATQPDVHLRIDVDRDSPSRNLVQLLDLCAFEKLSNYALHTRSSELDKGK